MGLQVIKELNEQLTALKQELKDLKGSAEEAKALADKIADLERKKEFYEPKVDKDTVKEAEKKASDLVLKAAVLGKPVDSFAEYKEIVNVIEKAIKPADINNWMDEKFTQDVINLLQPELKVESLFGSITIPDGVDTLSLPVKSGNTTAYRIQPDESAIESAITAGKISFNPEKVKVFSMITDEAKNEAVLSAIIDVVKEDMAYVLARACEDVIVNGDTSGTLNASPGGNSVTMIANGLRKFGDSNKVDNGGGTLSLDSLRSARKAMGYYGVNSKELALVVNNVVYNQLLALSDYQTLDKVGNSAVLLSGMIEYILGMKVIVSDVIPNNLTSAGVVDNTTPGTKTVALVVNTKAFKSATRKVIEAERDRDITKDRLLLSLRRFLAFNKVVVEDNPIASIVNVSGS